MSDPDEAGRWALEARPSAVCSLEIARVDGRLSRWAG